MKKLFKHTGLLLWLALPALFATGCVDELVPDPVANLNLEVRTVLNTNLSLEIKTKIAGKLDSLLSQTEVAALQKELELKLNSYFATEINDINLYAYTLDGKEVAGANQAADNVGATTKTFSIPFGNYKLVAIAYARSSYGTLIVDEGQPSTIGLVNAVDKDTITGHTYGVYSNKYTLLNPKNGETIDIPIYMNNGVMVLNVIIPDGLPFTVKKLYSQNSAYRYNINDSTYFYNNRSVVEYKVAKMTSHVTSCYALHYPTKRYGQNSSAIAATRVNSEAVRYPVSLTAIIEKGDGTYTKSDIKVGVTVDPGVVTIMNATVNPEGGLIPLGNSNCIVLVSVDWKPGSGYDIDI